MLTQILIAESFLLLNRIEWFLEIIFDYFALWNIPVGPQINRPGFTGDGIQDKCPNNATFNIHLRSPGGNSVPAKIQGGIVIILVVDSRTKEKGNNRQTRHPQGKID